MLNTTIKDYLIQSELGRGGMAVVYLAHDNKFDTNVAVKLLNKEYVHNDNIRKRFLAEARNMFRMSHPNIIKVTDLIDDGDTVAFVMEYIEGETLKDFLERKGKLGDEEIKSLFTQMLDALGYVHEQKLVHRDIKPSNFIITPNWNVKLMDFGIAKNIDSISAEYTQTGTSMQMGTPMYMSPEQVNSSKEVGPASDIYSLGVVLWQMITGEKPYDIKTLSIFQIQIKIVQESLRKTNTLWDTIIQKATEKEIGKRYSNFLDFKFELNKPRKNGIWDDGTTVFDQNDDQTILEKKESNKKNLHPKPKDHKVNTSDNLPHEKKSKKGLMFGIVIGVVLLIIIWVAKDLEHDMPEPGKISSYYMQEEGKFMFVDRFVLYTHGQDVIGFYGWAAQSESEFYLIGKLKGNEILGTKYSLSDSSSTKFKINISPKSIIGMSLIDKEVPIDTTDLFGKEDDFTNIHDIYELPNKNSKILNRKAKLSNKGFKIIEIGKMEKNNDEYNPYNIWYKIKNNQIEGWVFGLIQVLK
jgi:serine/threonine protein kinase